MNSVFDGSPRAQARIAGAVYIATGATAMIGEIFVRGKLIVRGDPAATAANILSHTSLWRAGGVADLVAAAGDATLALLFFVLFAGVSRPIALLAAFFRLVHVALLATITLLHFAPLTYLSTTTPLKGMSTPQLQAQAFAFFQLHSIGYNIALFFFGITCVARISDLVLFVPATLHRSVVSDRRSSVCREQCRPFSRSCFWRAVFPVCAGALRPWRVGADRLASCLWIE